MKKAIKLLIVALIISATTVSAQKTSLQLHLKKGDVYTQHTQMNNTMNQQMMGQSISMEQKTTMVTSLKVVDVSGSGNYILEQSYLQIKIDMNMNGQNMTIDTENTGSSSPLIAPFAKMKEAKVRFEVSPSGAISNVSGLNEILNVVTRNNPQTSNIIKNMVSESTLAAAFSYLPKDKVSKGDRYTNSIKLDEMFGMEITNKYTVSSIIGNSVNLDVTCDIAFAPEEPIVQNGMKMNIKITGTQNGTFVVDKSDGMATASNTKQVLDMTMSMKNPQNGQDVNIPMNINTDIKVTLTKN